MPKFDDANIELLFGADDAENERLDRFKQYFYYNNAYSSLTSDLAVRILVGHKGVGKSALLKRAYIADQETGSPCIWLRPDALLSVQEKTISENQFIQRIETWKKGMLIAAANELFGKDVVRIIPELESASVKNMILLMMKALSAQAKEKNLGDDAAFNIYIDDIDRGWTANIDSIKNISALLNAMRDIGGQEPRIRFRIGLRSDVYFLVRTSDESTDKIERNVIWLRWTNDEVLRVVAKRIATFFDLGISQEEIGKMEQSFISTNILSRVIDPEFKGRGRWEKRPIHKVLLSLTRARPRDLVKRTSRH
ncbi:P-loop ATPase, Sll1717 family [Methylocystis sp.]|uniref:P-loop ATPase, Sll1717 family n=1 Tax=Methylocystis sp. TaxID=1911079 RepID=UPI003DA306EB